MLNVIESARVAQICTTNLLGHIAVMAGRIFMRAMVG